MRYPTTLSLTGTVLVTAILANPLSAQPVADAPTVRLLEAGDEPRQELRYTVGADYRERISIEVSIGVGQSDSPVEVPAQNWPSFSVDVALGPTTPQDDGSIRYDVRVTHVSTGAAVEMDPDLAADLADDLERLRQAHGWLVRDPTGLIREIRLRTPDAVPMRVRELLGSLRQALVAVPFPTEPIGVGARWEVSQTVEREDYFPIEQTITYALTRLDGSTGALQATLQATASPRTFTAEDGSTVELHTYLTSGTGQITFDLGRLSPTSEADAQTNMHATRTIGGTPQPFHLGLWFGAAVNRAP